MRGPPPGRPGLTTLYHLARVVTRRGRLDDAAARFARLSPHAARVLGDEDRLVLEVRHGAAVVEALRGRLAAAEAALEEIHAVRDRVYGSADPDTLATRDSSPGSWGRRGGWSSPSPSRPGSSRTPAARSASVVRTPSPPSTDGSGCSGSPVAGWRRSPCCRGSGRWSRRSEPGRSSCDSPP
ncbi:tetratricopeptide repeat protein [Pseudonocardia halophobica]|uniref:tetratricopeptide repeat protein n=1 Tax=Pseudonocardia halophobica TaxID=29401 RepID=UPI003D89E03E